MKDYDYIVHHLCAGDPTKSERVLDTDAEVCLSFYYIALVEKTNEALYALGTLKKNA